MIMGGKANLGVQKAGFTLIELMTVLGIIVMLYSIASFSFFRTWRSGNLDTTVTDIIQTVHQAQAQTVSGLSADGVTPSTYGVYFEPTRMILFVGGVYVDGAESNDERSWSENLRLTTIDLPSSTVVFSRVDGTLDNYQSDSRTLVLEDTDTGESMTMVINKLGTIEIL